MEQQNLIEKRREYSGKQELGQTSENSILD